jgi:hypothetical protein
MKSLRMLACTVAIGTCAVAAEPIESTDEALVRELLGGERSNDASDAADPAQPAQTPAANAAVVDLMAVDSLLAGLSDAGERLSSGETGQPTQAAQSTVVRELERLIASAGGQASEPISGGEGRQSTAGSAPQPAPTAPSFNSDNRSEVPAEGDAGASEASTGPADRNRDKRAAESSDRLPERHDPPGRRRIGDGDLIREAWGHLPPRLREKLFNTGPDKYLPQYDSLVRSYFESLARPQMPGPEPRQQPTVSE